jgi:hypothetical protein
MPVFRNNKLVHIHIPKTGGTYIQQYFHSIEDLEWGPNSWIGQEWLDDRWFEFQHLSYSELVAFTGDEFRQFQCFAVVRNPYARLVSDFLWRQAIARRNPDSFVPSFETFDAFIASIPVDIDRNWSQLIRGASKSQANLLIHVRPQFHYVQSANGGAVENIIRFERIGEELNAFLKPLQLTMDGLGQRPERSFSDFYSPGTRKVVEDIYAGDFDMFGYDLTL